MKNKRFKLITGLMALSLSIPINVSAAATTGDQGWDLSNADCLDMFDGCGTDHVTYK